MPTHKIGFTGTRKGMTASQLQRLSRYVKIYREQGSTEFHHGDCIGADHQAHEVAKELGCDIHIHPPVIGKYRATAAYRMGLEGVVMHPTLPYIERNHKLVDSVNVLIATPAQTQEVLRSGTWATVRYARKRGIPVIILLP